MFYLDNSKFDKQTNIKIKKLVISSLKDLFYPINVIDNSEIYYTLDSDKIIQCDKNSNIKKSFFFAADRSFMDNIYMSEDNTYVGIVKLYFPKEYSCHIEIICYNGNYKISKFQLDI